MSSSEWLRLKKAWCAEQFSPEILAYEGDLVEGHLRRLAEMERSLDVEFSSSEQKMLANVYEMECERIKYVLKAYLKLRVHKIERFVMYILQHRLTDRLSAKEREYAQAYCDLLGEHLHKAFLCQLPDSFQSLTEPAMLPRPNLDRHVFVRVTAHIGDFQLDDTSLVNLELGDTYVMRYRAVQELLRQRRVELI
jgi:GINS complex subunit 4